jgi:hypothetical protein
MPKSTQCENIIILYQETKLTFSSFFISERNWNMWIPGFGTDELRPYKRAAVTEAHKQRLALIRKALKKY